MKSIQHISLLLKSLVVKDFIASWALEIINRTIESNIISI